MPWTDVGLTGQGRREMLTALQEVVEAQNREFNMLRVVGHTIIADICAVLQTWTVPSLCRTPFS